MPPADIRTYLADVVDLLRTPCPDNRTIHIVCHGHSVPAGYMATPVVDPFNAYPHLWHRALKEHYPYAVINVIVTAIGGESSEAGAARLADDVLPHRPDVLTIDYALNDRGLGLARAERAWRTMVEQALRAGVKVILLTPTWDVTGLFDPQAPDWVALRAHAELVRRLAGEYGVGLADVYAAHERYVAQGGDVTDLLCWVNHPSRRGHEVVVTELMRWLAYTKYAQAVLPAK